jgi:AAA domain
MSAPDANDIARKKGPSALRSVIDGGDRTTTPRFTVTPFNAIKLDPTRINYLVKGLLPRTGLVVIWGPPKCGKSFWVLDLAMHVALGWPYRGRRTRQGAVVYLALEGAEGFKARTEAIRMHHRVTDAPFYLMTVRIDLVRDHALLVADIRKQLGAVIPAAVFIDTLNRSLIGSEAKDEDMAAYLRAADAIREAFDCVVPVVHHCGINDSRPRGHTSLTGAADAQLAVKRDGERNFTVTVEYMKDGPEGDVLTCRLDTVDVGVDADGDAITSCIVVPVDDATPRPAARVKLTDRERLAMRFLAEALCDSGVQPPFDLPAGLKAVSRDAWRERCYRDGFCAGEKPGTRTKAFGRVVDSLQVKLLIGNRDGWVWLPSRTPDGPSNEGTL